MKFRLVLWLMALIPTLTSADTADTEQCAGCHSGAAIETRGMPNLDGQKAQYLRQQLLDFRSRARVSEEMNAIAAQLSDRTIDELATHFAGRSAPSPRAAHSMDPARPPLIFCVRCHGADGISPNDIWPNLAGQSLVYLRRQMQSYRTGERNDPMMASWGAKLSPEEIEDVLAYFERLGHRAGAPK